MLRNLIKNNIKQNITKKTDFIYSVVINTKHQPLKRSEHMNITNATCVLAWYDNTTMRYYIQKRSQIMAHGGNTLATIGGMLETTDNTLQYGALREFLEECQLEFKKTDNMSSATIMQLEECLFPISYGNRNITFLMILISKDPPKWNGPVATHGSRLFHYSLHEVDMEDKTWNNNNVILGHSFMTANAIKLHIKNNMKPLFWIYSVSSLKKIFCLLEY